MSTALPEPTGESADPALLFARYLDFYRDTVVRKVASLPDAEVRRSRLPSGWTPVQLLSHLLHMEQRWVVWGFLGERVDDPWGDARDDAWHVADDVSVDALVERLRALGRRTSAVLAEHAQDEVGVPGGRFDGDPPTLGWICFHVLQEYARHTGHLDAAVELAGGAVGE